MSRAGVVRVCALLGMAWSTACAEPRAGSTSAALNGAQALPQLRAAFESWRSELSKLAMEFEPGVQLSIQLDETRSEFSAKSALSPAHHIVISAGVLQAPELSPDALALLMCHELGHLFGGYPFMDENSALAAEGSADYFATRVCAPFLFERRASETQPDTNPRCAGQNQSCARLMAASLSLADALAIHFGAAEASVPPYAELADEPALSDEDDFRVDRTVGAHYPSVQCRLDTFARGALCGLEHGAGARVVARTEQAALAQSCSVAAFEPGARPSCWFREGSSPTGTSDALDVVWRALE